MKICIDAGHGGKDPGAVSGNIFEKDIVLSIALLLTEILEKQGIEVCLTRNADIFHSVSEKAKIANKSKSDLFISIHCNSAPSLAANGTEVLIYGKDGKVDKLAEDILDNLVDGLILRDRGVKVRKDLAVLNSTDMPAVLVETAFISNDSDRKKLMERQKDFAQAIADGIFKYLDIGGEEMEKGYKTLNEIPDWGKDAIKDAIEKGVFADKDDLNLTEDMVRMFVFNKRLGLY